MHEYLTKDIHINIPTKNNPILQQALEVVNQHQELQMLWRVANINALERLGMSDHGHVHIQIVANSSLRIARILMKNQVEMSVSKNYDLDNHYAELVVTLAALFHDVGITINRKNHEEYSLVVANPILKEVLSFLPVSERTVIVAEVLHAIISHRSDGKPASIEAGILRVADALDMGKGRSRIPYEAGTINIYSLSDTAIENVSIDEGTRKPVNITITLNNSAGIFQVDELLKNKLKGSGLEPYLMVKAILEGENEKKLLTEFTIN